MCYREMKKKCSETEIWTHCFITAIFKANSIGSLPMMVPSCVDVGASISIIDSVDSRRIPSSFEPYYWVIWNDNLVGYTLPVLTQS